MALTKTQLIGGLFQDSEGNVLANGYLIFELSQDEKVSDSNTEVCSGIRIRIDLNSSGSIATSPLAQYVWGNDDLLPINSFYRVWGYTSEGQLAWGPNAQQVISGATFDVGTWVPNLLTNWNPPVTSLTLQTNEVNNGSQALLDLHAGTGIALTDDGLGKITIANAATSVSLKTNGVANGSQSILNLKNGTGIAITDDGVGGITVAGPNINSAYPSGTIMYGGYGIGGTVLFSSSAPVSPHLPITEYRFRQIILSRPFTFNRASIYSVGAAYQNYITAAIYDSSLVNRLIYLGDDAINVPIATVSLFTSTLSSPVTLQAGVYYEVLSASTNGTFFPSMNFSNSGQGALLNISPHVRIGYATRTGASGHATISGALTGITADSTYAMASFIWE